MKNKKGFTLLELLVVLAIMSIIILIGTYGMKGVTKLIKKDLWEAKKELIIRAATNYGEEHLKTLKENQNMEIRITVQDLIDKNYIKTKEIIYDENNKKAGITNDTTGKPVNGEYIKIKYENNQVTIEYPTEKNKNLTKQ